MNTREKEEIWKEYFDKLLNTEEPRELIEKRNKEISEVEVEVEELTIEDVKRAIRNLKNNKVAGTDGITKKLNSVALVRERTIPTERPPPVGEVSANFYIQN